MCPSGAKRLFSNCCFSELSYSNATMRVVLVHINWYEACVTEWYLHHLLNSYLICMLYSVILKNKINITISICKRLYLLHLQSILLRVLPLDTYNITGPLASSACWLVWSAGCGDSSSGRLACSAGRLACSAGCLACSASYLACSVGCLACSACHLACSAGCLACSVGRLAWSAGFLAHKIWSMCNRIGGVLVSLLPSSVVDRGF